MRLHPEHLPHGQAGDEVCVGVNLEEPVLAEQFLEEGTRKGYDFGVFVRRGRGFEANVEKEFRHESARAGWRVKTRSSNPLWTALLPWWKGQRHDYVVYREGFAPVRFE